MEKLRKGNAEVEYMKLKEHYIGIFRIYIYVLMYTSYELLYYFLTYYVPTSAVAQ
jgi:hypothetical protein